MCEISKSPITAKVITNNVDQPKFTANTTTMYKKLAATIARTAVVSLAFPILDY